MPDMTSLRRATVALAIATLGATMIVVAQSGKPKPPSSVSQPSDSKSADSKSVDSKSATSKSAASLRPVSAFASTGDATKRSIALFEEAGKVIQHPRCINCHPAGDRPSQGMASRPHEPWVRRGADGFGAVGMRCGTCHQGSNFDPGASAISVPGHPKWHVAPIEMAWQGKTLGAICRQIKDPGRNGGHTLEQIVTHMSDDSLVGWAWAPGSGREPAPGTQAAFGQLIRAWVESGAACPAS
jgi:hypothetical protein